jgi:hypothetical protein
MKTRVDVLTTFPRPAKAANEEFVPALNDNASRGWDAYEVWRTRVKVQQDKSKQPQRIG